MFDNELELGSQHLLGNIYILYLYWNLHAKYNNYIHFKNYDTYIIPYKNRESKK